MNFRYLLLKIAIISLIVQGIYSLPLPKFENEAIYPIVIIMIITLGIYFYEQIFLPYKKNLGKRLFHEILIQNLEEGKITVFLINLGRYSIYKEIDHGKYIKVFQKKKSSPQKLKKDLMRILLSDK